MSSAFVYILELYQSVIDKHLHNLSKRSLKNSNNEVHDKLGTLISAKGRHNDFMTIIIT